MLELAKPLPILLSLVKRSNAGLLQNNNSPNGAKGQTYGSQFPICLVDEQSAKLHCCLGLRRVSVVAFKSGRLDCHIEQQQRAVYSRKELTRDILFAARDYLRISRAATDATGASLTVWKEDQSGSVEIRV